MEPVVESAVAPVAVKEPKEQGFDELTLIRSVISKFKKLDYNTTERVLAYAVKWNESRKPV